MEQQGMQAAQERLNKGDWVHVFPEGTRSIDGRMGQARSGVGRLVAACEQPPLGECLLHCSCKAAAMERLCTVPSHALHMAGLNASVPS